MENDRPKTHSEMIEDELGRPHTVKSAGVREYVLGAQRRGEEIAGLVADLTALEAKRALEAIEPPTKPMDRIRDGVDPGD